MLPYNDVLNIGAGAGALITLPGSGAQGVRLTARSEIYVKPFYGPQATAPVAPVASPAPNAGAEAPGWLHLLSTDLPQTIAAEDGADQPLITFLQVWGTGAGKLEIYAY